MLLVLAALLVGYLIGSRDREGRGAVGLSLVLGLVLVFGDGYGLVQLITDRGAIYSVLVPIGLTVLLTVGLAVTVASVKQLTP